MLPSAIQNLCGTCLPDAIGEGLSVVRAMPHAGGLVPKCDACGVEEARVRIPQGVPSHAVPVKVTHRPAEGFVCGDVVTAEREFRAYKDLIRSWRQGDYSPAALGLGGIEPSVPVGGAPDVDDSLADVIWAQTHDLSPAQAGEKDQFPDDLPLSAQATEDQSEAAEEEARALRLEVAALEEAQGELLEQLDHSVYVSERPDYCRVCDRHFW